MAIICFHLHVTGSDSATAGTLAPGSAYGEWPNGRDKSKKIKKNYLPFGGGNEKAMKAFAECLSYS
jgi:hypothetical protein